MLLCTLGKGSGLTFEQTWIPFTQGCFVPSFAEICLVVLEKKKMWNVCENDHYDDNHDDDNADDGQQTSFDQRGSLEPSAWWAKKNIMCRKDCPGYESVRTHWSDSHKGESVKVYCFVIEQMCLKF